MRLSSFFLGLVCSVCCLSATARAHFPWLIVDEDGKAALFFGESLADRTYKLPEAVSKATVTSTKAGKSVDLALSLVEADGFIGRVSKSKVEDGTQLTSAMTYGIYNGSRLNYFASHVSGALPVAKDDSSETSAADEAFSTQLVKTDEGVDLYISWKGKPLADTEVHLYCDEGHEEGLSSTDENGKVSFTKSEVEDGLNGIMFGQTITDDAGKIGDEEYKSTMYYCTITFVAPNFK